MFSLQRIRACEALFATLCLSLSLTHAQTVFYVEHDGKMHPARSAKGVNPCVELGGKLVPANGRKFGLKPVDEYLPAYVAVRELSVFTRGFELSGGGNARLASDFEVRAKLESALVLENVFLVLELDSEYVGKTYFVREVGMLEPDHPKSINSVAQMKNDLGSVQYTLHIYANGAEVMHSAQAFEHRAAVLDRMVARRVNGVKDAAPRPFVLPPIDPVVDAAGAIQAGMARVRLRIQKNGTVHEPAVVSASASAIGESAVAAVSGWRFLPKVTDGSPVDCTIEIPLRFGAPEESAATR